MRSQSAQSLRGHQPSPFQERVIAPQPQIAVPSMTSGEATEKIPPHLSAYSSLKREYGKKETNPFSAAAGIEVALKHQKPILSVDATEDTDVWDFDSSDTDSASSDTRAEEPIEYGRKLSLSKRRQSNSTTSPTSTKSDSGNFKVKFALRGHLDVVRAVVFTSGGTASEPEICTTGDDGVLKRWFIPGNYGLSMSGLLDVDVTSHFTHRGHAGMVTSLAAYPGNANDGGGGGGGGWVFSGGQDSTIKIWEAGKVDPVETLVGHTDAVWAVCVLPSASAILESSDERILLASGSADGTIKIWSVTAPPGSPRRPSSSASNSNVGSLRTFSAGYSNNITTTFEYSLISTISRPGVTASPTSITPMSVTGETFIVSYNDASVIIYDTASCEEVVSMASQETYDGTPATGVSSVVATTMSLESGAEAGKEEDVLVAGATGQRGGIGGVLITGHEDRYVRIFDANSGQCTYTMLAHPAAISSLALSPDGRELVSAGHDASLRFWSMEKRACTQEITCHRLMRGEGVCCVIWSADGKWVVSGGGDGVVKVYCR
ncbi:WD40-repeat-containing domain protein [Trichophaea hybrida]|nr:WD40-repeat-containing domain protein [Trichophaea hybrida]